MSQKSLITIGLLILANIFMTFAWYLHLKLKTIPYFAKWGLFSIILFSWGIAFFEYLVQVPANRIGYTGNNGPFTLIQLKIIQEVITLFIFLIFTLLIFKTETIRWNHLVSMVFIIIAVFFAFKK